MAKKLLKRSEVKEEYTWNLKDMYASDEDWKKDLTEIDKILDEIGKMEGKVAASAKNLLFVLENAAKAGEKLDYDFEYAERLFDEDQKNTAHQAMSQKMYSMMTKVSSRTAFIVPEILTMDENVLEGYYKELPELELYRKQIEEIERTKAHTLSAEMEKLVAMTGDMAETSGQVYSIINNADFVFPEIKDEEGDTVRLSHGNFVPFEESADRRVRKDAFEGFYGVYKQYANTLAALYNGQVKQQIFYANARHYASTLEAAVDANNVSPSVYYNLIDTINKNMDKMHRYVRLRKKCLGVDELHMYDMYVPLVNDYEVSIPFDMAKQEVEASLSVMGKEYVDIFKSAFTQKWIDIYENVGKCSGAYSAGAKVHPYVLLNYNDTLDSEFTLAHEMGHAIHSYYSNRYQPEIYSNYVIFVAEVASTCNESLLMQYLLKHTDDKKRRAYLINYFLEQFRTTLYRQTMFAEFELKINTIVEQGQSLTADMLCEIYGELNKLYFGDDVVIDDNIKLEWSRIPHFYYDFYVYQYATGFSSAIALSRKILNEGEPAVKDYINFLKGGCSKDPVDLLKGAGVDIVSGDVVGDALKLFGELIDELDSLLS